jgi:hypothetical protein
LVPAYMVFKGNETDHVHRFASNHLPFRGPCGSTMDSWYRYPMLGVGGPAKGLYLVADEKVHEVLRKIS